MGLLIFYVTNVTNETNVINVHFVGFSNKDCWIFQHTFPRKSGTFAPNFKARWNYENNENNEKLRKKLWVSLSSGNATKA